VKQTFDRPRRLSRTKEFEAVFKKGRVFKVGFCKVFVSFNQLSHSRLGTVVPKRAIKLSTHRHRFKRIIRESFRLNQTHFTGCDIIVLMLYRPENAEQLWLTLALIWKKLNQWCNAC
jgi:ribonuclease P protein component